MKTVKLCAIFLVVIFFATGCGGSSNSNGDSNSNSSVPAPSSLAGKSYKMTIDNGSAPFASAGISMVVFSNTAMTYKVLGDGVNTFNSSGSYTYTTIGSQGNAAIVDSAISNGNFTLTFISSTTGTFQATAELAANSNQTGSFIVL
ncbi:hypothetical protein [uncultured Paraglaciecola sp.]|jgi:hypothetical protein|uniref:hypothetical protein n=1 Tax=uncultured Paraglaciecola sp. TaxID=1765024 RepID=UPI0025D6AF36|nr:hypothetical protein [uncultured Paraglaciecola sp.]